MLYVYFETSDVISILNAHCSLRSLYEFAHLQTIDAQLLILGDSDVSPPLSLYFLFLLIQQLSVPDDFPKA